MNDPIQELQIRNLIARLAHAADTASEEDFDALYLDGFTEDAVWEAKVSGPGFVTRRGRQDIRVGVLERRRAGVQGPGSQTMHIVMTTHVTFEEASAKATSKFMVLKMSVPPQIAFAGLYDDRFRCENGVWRMAHRIIGQV